MTEKQLQGSVENLARYLGWLSYHTFDSRRSSKGFPDLCMAHPEHGVVFAELKAAKGKLRSEQEHWRGVLERGGARVFVWRPDDWVEGRILAVLKGD